MSPWNIRGNQEPPSFSAVPAAAYRADTEGGCGCVDRAARVALWSHVSLPEARGRRAGGWSREHLNLLTHLLIRKFLPLQGERELQGRALRVRCMSGDWVPKSAVLPPLQVTNSCLYFSACYIKRKRAYVITVFLHHAPCLWYSNSLFNCPLNSKCTTFGSNLWICYCYLYLKEVSSPTLASTGSLA